MRPWPDCKPTQQTVRRSSFAVSWTQKIHSVCFKRSWEYARPRYACIGRQDRWASADSLMAPSPLQNKGHSQQASAASPGSMPTTGDRPNSDAVTPASSIPAAAPATAVASPAAASSLSPSQVQPAAPGMVSVQCMQQALGNMALQIQACSASGSPSQAAAVPWSPPAAWQMPAPAQPVGSGHPGMALAGSPGGWVVDQQHTQPVAAGSLVQGAASQQAVVQSSNSAPPGPWAGMAVTAATAPATAAVQPGPVARKDPAVVGDPPAQGTLVWVLSKANNMYVAAECLELFASSRSKTATNVFEVSAMSGASASMRWCCAGTGPASLARLSCGTRMGGGSWCA